MVPGATDDEVMLLGVMVAGRLLGRRYLLVVGGCVSVSGHSGSVGIGISPAHDGGVR